MSVRLALRLDQSLGDALGGALVEAGDTEDRDVAVTRGGHGRHYDERALDPELTGAGDAGALDRQTDDAADRPAQLVDDLGCLVAGDRRPVDRDNLVAGAIPACSAGLLSLTR